MSDLHPLQAEMRNARKKISCCSLVIVNYEPGCSYARCPQCNKLAAVPDWNPEGLVKAWNDQP